MSPKIIALLIPLALVYVSLIPVFILLYVFRLSRKRRRSPLTQNLLRTPGESLRTQIEEVTATIDSYLVLFLLLPLGMYSVYLTQKYIGRMQTEASAIAIYTAASAIIIVFCSVKLWRLLRQRTDLRLGLDCELAVGQELNHLMLEECRVYHDFPAEKFNIDHIVVGPKGVFAVETKGRSKPDKKGGKEEATVIFDGQILRFPNRFESDPIRQAKDQAAWLSKWLTSAVGEPTPIAVQPVLVLPGWFIVREKPSDLFIFNGKDPDMLLKYSNLSLPETIIKRLSHQLEQRCRDVEPLAYSKQSK